MLTVTKDFTWDSSHMLYGHNGLCKNVHGHTYKMQVEVARLGDQPTIDGKCSSEGMVVDFKNLKTIVEDRIISKLDHAFITSCEKAGCEQTAEVEWEIAQVLVENKLKVFYLGVRPTAENMAIEFAGVIDRSIKEAMGLKLVSITIWETPTSFAKYTL